MKTTRVFTSMAFVVVLLLILSVVVACESKNKNVPVRKENLTNGNTPAVVAPIVYLDSSSDMKVDFLFENASQKPIRYFLADDDRKIAQLQVLLYKQKKFIETLVVPTGAWLNKDRLRDLEPGKSIVITVNLSGNYKEKDLLTGRYELILCYHRGQDDGLVTEYGLTPMSFEQKIIVEIR